MCRPKKYTKTEYRYILMADRLLWDIPVEYLMQFELPKLKLLNSMLTHQPTENWSAKDYMTYVSRFYYDPAFEACYDLWVDSGYMRSLRPSLDHIRPRADGGQFVLENLQVIPWCINRMKGDSNREEWAYVQRLFLKGKNEKCGNTDFQRWF